MEPSRFTLRIHPLILEKLKVVAENNGRSLNKEIEQILKWVVDDYERQYGKIKVEPERRSEPQPTSAKAEEQAESQSLFNISTVEKK